MTTLKVPAEIAEKLKNEPKNKETVLYDLSYLIYVFEKWAIYAKKKHYELGAILAYFVHKFEDYKESINNEDLESCRTLMQSIAYDLKEFKEKRRKKQSSSNAIIEYALNILWKSEGLLNLKIKKLDS